MRTQILWLVILVSVLALYTPNRSLAQGDSVSAAVDLRATEAVELADEIDSWRGSSLGIRLDRQDGKVVVTKIHDHAIDVSPFNEGDELVSLEGIVLAEKELSDIGQLLSKTQPGSKLSARIIRDTQTLTQEVTTLRQPLVDIAPLCERLSSNRIIKKHLTDTQRPDFLTDMPKRMVAAVNQTQSPRESFEAINRIIDEIGVSHTAIVPELSYSQLTGGAGGDVGLTLQRHRFNGRNGYFVIDIKPGTVGCVSEIKIGDEIVKVNDVEIEKSRRLILAGEEDRYNVFALLADPGKPIRLEILKSPFEETISVQLQPDAEVSTVDVLKKSARIYRVANTNIGYVRFWNLMSMELPRVFSKQLETDFANCDAIIMDLRGRGGMVPVLLVLERSVKQLQIPVVAITDELTRSAKEMLSYRLKKLDHVTVIGQKTAGAVTGATFTKLPSGNVLMYPAASADNLKGYLDGNIIEGEGVEPDEQVVFFVPYCDGNDRLLEAALHRAAELSTQAR